MMNSKRRIENECQTLKEVAKGDSRAFRTLYMHYYDRLFQFAMLFLRSETGAEDVVADVFFNIWKDRTTLTGIPNFQAYIYQAVRYGCLNVLKSGYVSKRSDLPEIEMQVTIAPDSPLDELAYKELSDAVQQAVNALPERCRMVFKMSREDEMSQQEIADALGVQLCTVQRQTLLAKAKIKQAIEPFLEKK
ncbi:RNA polymerase sigma-70 factor [Bacteroides reticulotermitis]|uniref:RNA polymerase sigma-70 factor n=1 Tax=Bacteroides reticulotermitis TaxID=1133319 RepID=UPI001DE3B885|nr:RNA polymerase sigma-70 factor [Bacteroides reticulotermitis]